MKLKKFQLLFAILCFVSSSEIWAHTCELTQKDENLMALAHAHKEKAFIPGARTAYKVGVVLVLEDGSIVTDANIKMANGLTLCAERVALSKALIDQGLSEKNLIQRIYIANNQEEPSTPCGICRQSLSFFARPETLFFFEDKNSKVIIKSMMELLPNPYIWRYAPSKQFFD